MHMQTTNDKNSPAHIQRTSTRRRRVWGRIRNQSEMWNEKWNEWNNFFITLMQFVGVKIAACHTLPRTSSAIFPSSAPFFSSLGMQCMLTISVFSFSLTQESRMKNKMKWNLLIFTLSLKRDFSLTLRFIFQFDCFIRYFLSSFCFTCCRSGRPK